MSKTYIRLMQKVYSFLVNRMLLFLMMSRGVVFGEYVSEYLYPVTADRASSSDMRMNCCQ